MIRIQRLVIALLVFCACSSTGAQIEPVTEIVRFAVSTPVADMHSAPSADSDVVSQATFGSPAVLVEPGDGWTKVRTSDDYLGWIRNRDLAPVIEPYASTGRVATVTSLFAALYREADIEKHASALTIPFEARLEISGEQETPDGRFYAARLPDGTTAWVQQGDVTFDARTLSIDETLQLAGRFIGLPYRWGGTSSFGFDCSGFTQMLMRRRGIAMPRDTRPQSRWDGLAPVDRAELRPGDLLFFGRVPEKINHTAMYLGNGEFIHATRRGRPSVQIGQLSSEPWNTQFITARRAK